MLHPKMKYTYVGIDSHKDTHCAVFLNCFYEKLGEIEISGIPGEFENFLKDAQKYRLEKTSFAFGFEDVSAYGRSLVKFLKGKKQLVKHVDATLVASERKSRNLLHKTDSIDAECAARVLLSRFDELPDANPQDKYWVLSNLVARRDSMVKINVMLKNHLHSLIPDNYPGYHKFFTQIDCNSSLAFYEKYPSPSMLMGVSIDELAGMFSETSHYRVGEKKAVEIFKLVKRDGVRTPEYQEARNFTIQSTVRQIKANKQEIGLIDTEIADFLDNFDYQLTSMRGIDSVMAAKLIAEIGDIERFPTSAKLARYAGVAPVTYASGQTDVQYSNQRGNRNLNEIFFRLALTTTMTSGSGTRVNNPFLYEYYRRKMAEGKTKRQALKCVERRLVNIIWGMMKHKTEYINPPVIDVPEDYVRPEDEKGPRNRR